MTSAPTLSSSVSPLDPSAPVPAFEDALRTLEDIVRALEANQLPLEDALAAFERGTLLLKSCSTMLNQAEQRISILEAESLREITFDSQA